MCGIAGFINRIGLVNDLQKHELDLMLRKIYHRGPDDTGVCGISDRELYNREKAVDIVNNVNGILGFNRLSIQDLSPAGHQPMLSDDKKEVITFNGEIYNVDELKQTLKNDGCDMLFRGHSDTEVILKCYKMYGIEKTLRMLNGMFAIVIADIDRKALYIARDRIGIIPLHIMVNEDKIVWSSEIKAFLALSDFKREVSTDALSDALKFCYPNSPMYREVENVEPGTYISYQWGNNIIRKNEFFSFKEYGINQHRISVEECEAALKNCLYRQLVSDAPVGVQLSGGIDSTLLAKYTSDVFQNNGLELSGFSLVNRRHPEYSEEKWIDHALEKLRIDSHKYDFNDDIFAYNFEKSLYAFERFVNIPSPVGIYTFSSEARKYVTVLISGEGADELVGGYSNFTTARLFDIYVGIFGEKSSYKHINCIPNTYNLHYIMNFDSMLSNDACRRIYPDFCIDKSVQMKTEYIASLSGSGFEKLRMLYFKEELVSLLERQNKICMANSIENRVPFLDNKFVELMFSIDESQLVHPMLNKAVITRNPINILEGKYILKQMSSKVYGKEFAFRTKQAVRIPIATYIKNKKFTNYLNELIIPGMKRRGIIDMREFNSAYENLNENSNTTMVWKAINLEAWMQLFYDGRNVKEPH